MDNLISVLLSECGVDTARATSVASTIFDVRDVPRLEGAEIDYFRTSVTKILYVAKRVKPECLTAVAFLTTRVAVCDVVDLSKLRRLLGYLRYSRHRGIARKIDDPMEVGGTRVQRCGLRRTLTDWAVTHGVRHRCWKRRTVPSRQQTGGKRIVVIYNIMISAVDCVVNISAIV